MTVCSDDTEQQYRALLAAVVLRAVKDAGSRNARLRADAVHWLCSGQADNVALWLDVDPERLRSLDARRHRAEGGDGAIWSQ